MYSAFIIGGMLAYPKMVWKLVFQFFMSLGPNSDLILKVVRNPLRSSLFSQIAYLEGSKSLKVNDIPGTS